MARKKQRFLILTAQSIIACNIGYTLFLLPILNKVYPKRVPFTVENIAAFAAVDSIAGILLATLIYFIFKKTKLKMGFVSGISIAFLWLLYWLPLSLKNFQLLIIGLDGAAALITWLVFIVLHSLFQSEKGGVI